MKRLPPFLTSWAKLIWGIAILVLVKFSDKFASSTNESRKSRNAVAPYRPDVAIVTKIPDPTECGLILISARSDKIFIRAFTFISWQVTAALQFSATGKMERLCPFHPFSAAWLKIGYTRTLFALVPIKEETRWHSDCDTNRHWTIRQCILITRLVCSPVDDDDDTASARAPCPPATPQLPYC